MRQVGISSQLVISIPVYAPYTTPVRGGGLLNVTKSRLGLVSTNQSTDPCGRVDPSTMGTPSPHVPLL